MYANLESLCCTPGTNVELYVSYTSVKKEIQVFKLSLQSLLWTMNFHFLQILFLPLSSPSGIPFIHMLSLRFCPLFFHSFFLLLWKLGNLNPSSSSSRTHLCSWALEWIFHVSHYTFQLRNFQVVLIYNFCLFTETLFSHFPFVV